MFPNEKSYRDLAVSYEIIPIYTKFKEDYYTPIAIYEKLKSLHPDFLLESAGQHQDDGRFSYIGLNCKHIEKPLEEVCNLSNKALKLKELPPFYNGHIGYMSYESVSQLHPLTIHQRSSIKNMQLLYAKITIIIDHIKNEVYIVNNVVVNEESYLEASEVIQKIKGLILRKELFREIKKHKGTLKIQSNMTYKNYEKMINKAKEYIISGDIFQVVLSQQFTAPLQVDPFEIYKSVRRENPSPYLSFINFDGFISICSSPEMLIKSDNKTLQTVPIAGTRAVKYDGKDYLREEELISDEKETSEHLMLVDLSRNDLNKVSKPGSVNVRNYCELKKFSRVMHLTSLVTSELKDTSSSIDALKSTFPAGTVSGAPKIRAMEIIDELEQAPRNLYAGTIFYLNNDLSLNSCIAIRTMIITDKITIQSGSGIVLHSNAEDEYKETLHKANALFKSLENLYQGGLQYDFSY